TVPQSDCAAQFVPEICANCASARFAVDATSAPTFTCDPAPNMMPLGLSTNTWPGALIAPRIWLGDALGSLTRFSTVQSLPPWLNRRVVLAPTLKLFRVRSAVFAVWLTVTIVPPECPTAPVRAADAAALGSAAPDQMPGFAATVPGLTHKPPGVSPLGTDPGTAFRAACVCAA